MENEIDKGLWQECKICNKKIQELAKVHGGNGVFYSQVFIKHIEIDHLITIESYFNQYLNIDIPICACNTCSQKVDITYKGSKLYWKQYRCGRHPGTMEWSQNAKTTRLGKNNPMYGKAAWNKNLTKENCPQLKTISEKMSSRIMSEASKTKMSESAKKRLIHGHTGHKHSDKNKELFRRNTIKMIKEGKFKQNRSKPFLKLGELLKSLNIDFEEEKRLHYWSFDYYLPKYDVYIEVDGDYFHSNPKIYPDGPKTKTQKINHTRDISKNNYCIQNNIELYRFWESDILSNQGLILCKLRGLLGLNS